MQASNFIPITNPLQLTSPSSDASLPFTFLQPCHYTAQESENDTCTDPALQAYHYARRPTSTHSGRLLDINSKQRAGGWGVCVCVCVCVEPLGPLNKPTLSGNGNTKQHLDRCLKTQRTKSTLVQAHKCERGARARSHDARWGNDSDQSRRPAEVSPKMCLKMAAPPPPPLIAMSSRQTAHLPASTPTIFWMSGLPPFIITLVRAEKKKTVGLLKIKSEVKDAAALIGGCRAAAVGRQISLSYSCLKRLTVFNHTHIVL